MANEEHLAILRQGVEVWNQWRNDNSVIIPSLRRASLRGADLSFAKLWDADLHDADLKEANLKRANLRGANLSDADLWKADLWKADLSEANLSFAKLWDADLSKADLSKANLRMSYLNNADLSKANCLEAVLWNANLREAKLWQANLSKADLSYAQLWKADLSQANLKEANLKKAQLSYAQLWKADLSQANLSGLDLSELDLSEFNLRGANLRGANLSGLDLSELDLSEFNLRGANLSRVQALGTNFTAATFTGACIQDWNINSSTNLTDVICDYIYLRQGQQERRPSSGNFAPGEFTKLFKKSLETLDLIFRNGIDWDAFAYSFKKVEVENQDAQLDVQSIEKKGDGILVVRVAVSVNADKAKIHNEFMQGYEFAHKALEAQYQARLEDKDKEINRLFYLLDQANNNPKKISNYYQQNSQFAGGIVDANTVQSHQIGGDVYNTDNQENPD